MAILKKQLGVDWFTGWEGDLTKEKQDLGNLEVPPHSEIHSNPSPLSSGSDNDLDCSTLLGFLRQVQFKRDLEKRRAIGWRDGSVAKSTDCSSRGLGFNSHQPHGGSQPSVMGSNALFWCVWRHWQCSHIYKINLEKKKIIKFLSFSWVHFSFGIESLPSRKLLTSRKIVLWDEAWNFAFVPRKND